MKEVIATVFLLTISLVSIGKTQISPLQNESLSKGCIPEISEIPLISPAPYLNKCLNIKEISYKDLSWIVENKNKRLKDDAAMSVKREPHCKISAIKNISGKQVKTLLSKKMAHLLYAVSVEEFSILRIKTDSAPGTKDVNTPFVSYYPGLLNEKIL